MEIGITLKEIRADKKLTQGAVSAATGISQTHLSQIEKGRKNVSIDLLRKLATYYKIPLALIFLRSLTEDDVEPAKRLTFRKLMPALKDLTNTIWNG